MVLEGVGVGGEGVGRGQQSACRLMRCLETIDVVQETQSIICKQDKGRKDFLAGMQKKLHIYIQIILLTNNNPVSKVSRC